MHKARKLLTLLSIPLAFGLSQVAYAEGEINRYESYGVPFLGIGVGYSNVGHGVDLTMRISPRIGVNYSFYEQNETISVGNDLSIGLDILNRGFSFDFFPLENNLHMTLGFLVPDNKSDFNINSPKNIHADIDSVNGNIKLGSGFTPYLGVGYKQNNSTGLGYFIEAGVSYLKPVVSASYESENRNSNTDDAFNNFKNDIKNELDDYKFNPLIKLGVFYVF